MSIRVGIGYDVHRLVSGAPLILGGVRVEARQGAVGHSDADVLTHAVCDALLGATSMGDIGTRFPDSDPQYKGLKSLLFLEEVMLRVHALGYRVQNMDSTVALERPVLRPHIPKMVASLAKFLEVEADCVSIKATTTEGLGFVGQRAGIAAYAVVLLAQP